MITAAHTSFVANRAETRFTVHNGEVVDQLPHTIEENVFPNSVPTSIYFGCPDTPEPVPEGGVLRFRFRQEELIPDSHAVHVLSPGQPGDLELKLYNGGHAQNRKLRLGNLTLGQATDMLATPEGMDQLALLEGGAEFSKEVQAFFGCQGVTPFHMVQADRRQFSINGPETSARVTCDSGTTFWRLGRCSIPDLGYGVRSVALPYRILEIKTEAPIDPEGPEATGIITELFGAQAVYKWVSRIKRLAAKELCDGLGAPDIHNSGFEQNDKGRYFYEQELKIDVAEDPRSAIRALPERPIPGVYLHRATTSATRFRVHEYPGGVQVIEKADDDAFTGSFFQFKEPVGSDSDGQLVRHEYSARSVEALWEKVGHVALDGDVATTATATRHRVTRPIVCEQTGNVFMILADHCTSTDGRAPLDQIEVEYIGTLGFAHNLGNPSPESIAADFAMLRELASAAAGDKVLPGATTKQEWLTANRQTAPE